MSRLFKTMLVYEAVCIAAFVAVLLLAGLLDSLETCGYAVLLHALLLSLRLLFDASAPEDMPSCEDCSWRRVCIFAVISGTLTALPFVLFNFVSISATFTGMRRLMATGLAFLLLLGVAAVGHGVCFFLATVDLESEPGDSAAPDTTGSVISNAPVDITPIQNLKEKR